jgi:hypothetical protein
MAFRILPWIRIEICEEKKQSQLEVGTNSARMHATSLTCALDLEKRRLVTTYIYPELPPSTLSLGGGGSRFLG